MSKTTSLGPSVHAVFLVCFYYMLRLGYMRGHGTYMDQDVLFASVAGVVERVNKLISVTPVKTRYNGEIGDVVVGRYDEHC